MQLQLFIQMLNGAADDWRKGCCFTRKKWTQLFPNRIFKPHFNAQEGFSPYLAVEALFWTQTERIAAFKASWVIGAQQQHLIVWNASPWSSSPIYTHRLHAHGLFPVLTISPGKNSFFNVFGLRLTLFSYISFLLKRCCVHRVQERMASVWLNLVGLHITMDDVLSPSYTHRNVRFSPWWYVILEVGRFYLILWLVSNGSYC